jgi:NAD(P)-dependent dehydrogenase (short-subunit alcohol dehydrogenase family)
MLKEKVALVTGGAQGIGLCTALKMAEYGAKVAILDYNEAGAKAAAEQIQDKGGQAAGIFCDVSKRESCQTAVKTAAETFGTIDIAANCAGINVACKMIDMTDELWDRINNIDLKGTLYISQEAAKIMRKHRYGRIVNIGSISGKIPEDMNGAYCVAKAGVLMLSKVMALELAEDNITVNAICPGPVNTNIMKEVFEQRGVISGMTPEEFRKFFLRDIPLGRMAEPEDIAELICFLSSDRASYITGVDYTISGGKIFH